MKQTLTHVICLSEHWLCENEIPLYIPEGFTVGSSYCRRPPLVHGGTSILINSKIKYEILVVTDYCIDLVCEASAIVLLDYDFIVLSVYRTPNSNFNTFVDCLEKLLLYISTCRSHKYFAVCGDFNVDISKTHKSEVQYFLNILRSYNLYYTNEQPTRNKAVLDNIFTNVVKDNYKLTILSQDIISDHAGIWVNFSFPFIEQKESLRNHSSKVNKRLISPDRLSNFKECLSNSVWDCIYDKNNDVHTTCSNFLNVLTYYFNIHCPKVLVKCKDERYKQSKNWYTPELKNMRSYLLFLYDKWKNNLSLCDKVIFKNFKKIYNKAVWNAKLTANDKLLAKSQNKCKTAWKIINNECNNYKSSLPHKVPISPDRLNKYFVNISVSKDKSNNQNSVSSNLNFVELLSNFPRPNKIVQYDFRWKLIDERVVKSIITKLSNSHSEDIYGLSNFILKEIMDIILAPLTYIINSILQTNTFPNCLKFSKIIPIFKKGDQNLAENYRPIAIVPVISKVIESCIMDQLYCYFESNRLIYKHQFGFRPKYSTSMAVESVVDIIIRGFENKLVMGSVLIDLCKAFDTISHTILFKKLDYYGIRGQELCLIKSYLLNRKQRVDTYKSSSYLDVVAGVPQGSVLGPFLFLVFMNDFSSNVPTPSILYADDTTLICSENSISKVNFHLTQSLDSAKIWYSANNLMINQEKTEHTIFSLRKQFPHAKESLYKPVKLLGITLDSKLCWNVHIENVCKKLSRVIYLLRKLKHCVNPNTLLLAYFGFFHIHLCYGIRLWGNASSAPKVFLWQKKAVRILAGLNSRESCRDSFSIFNIMTFTCIYIYSNLSYVRENINRFNNNNIQAYNTRNKHDLAIPNFRLSKSLNSFSYQQIKLFNKLPLNIRSMSLIKFNNKVSKWLKSKSFYSLDEFMNCDMHDLVP